MTAYSKLYDVRSYSNFERMGRSMLVQAVSDLFGCQVEFSGSAVNSIKDTFGIDITDQWQRTTYVIGEDSVVIVSRIMEDKAPLCHLALVLRGRGVSAATSLLNTFANALTHSLTHSYKQRFRDSAVTFGDQLIEKVIANYLAVGHYDPIKINYTFGLLKKLGNTTFEDRHFTTGVIFTRSTYAYAGKKGADRHGNNYSLKKPYSLKKNARVDKRFWFMADGQHSFYLATRDLAIKHMFVRDTRSGTIENFLDSYTLSKTLYGGDIALRTTGRGEVSVVSSRGEEYAFINNAWRYREFDVFCELIQQRIGCEAAVASALVYYLLYCSQNKISSIIWIPDNIRSAAKSLVSRNRLVQIKASILREDHSPLIKRYLASDGATMIDKNGRVQYYACIVDFSELTVRGVAGTVESAARLLSANGIAAKVSQDGNISVFLGSGEDPFVL